MDEATINTIVDKILAQTDLQVAFISLAGAVVGGLLTAGGNLVMHVLSKKREIRLQLVSIELKRLYEIEELVGIYVEEVTSYKALNASKISELAENIDEHAGKLRKYRDLMQAIRNVSQHGKILAAEKLKNPSAQNERHELEHHYQDFIKRHGEVLKDVTST